MGINIRTERPEIIATTDYTEFFTEWAYRIRSMGYAAGLSGDLLEEMVQEIQVHLWRGQYLEKYDATEGPFATFIFGHIRVRISDFKRRLWTRGQRETVVQTIFDSDMHPFADHELPEPMIVLASDVEEVEKVIKRTYTALGKYPATKTKNLARLFRDIVEQVILGTLQPSGDINIQGVADKYGYSRQAMHAQLKTLMGTPEMAEFHDTIAKRRAKPA